MGIVKNGVVILLVKFICFEIFSIYSYILCMKYIYLYKVKYTLLLKTLFDNHSSDCIIIIFFGKMKTFIFLI